MINLNMINILQNLVVWLFFLQHLAFPRTFRFLNLKLLFKKSLFILNLIFRQWTSFLAAASTSGYVYMYSFYYFFFKTKLVQLSLFNIYCSAMNCSIMASQLINNVVWYFVWLHTVTAQRSTNITQDVIKTLAYNLIFHLTTEIDLYMFLDHLKWHRRTLIKAKT